MSISKCGCPLDVLVTCSVYCTWADYITCRRNSKHFYTGFEVFVAVVLKLWSFWRFLHRVLNVCSDVSNESTAHIFWVTIWFKWIINCENRLTKKRKSPPTVRFLVGWSVLTITSASVWTRLSPWKRRQYVLPKRRNKPLMHDVKIRNTTIIWSLF